MTRAVIDNKSTYQTITDLVVHYSLALYRDPSNASGALAVGVCSGPEMDDDLPFGERIIDVTQYTASAWHKIEGFIDLTGYSIGGNRLYPSIGVPYWGVLTGGPVYVGDFKIVTERGALVLFQTTATTLTLSQRHIGRQVYASSTVTLGSDMNNAPNGTVWTVVNSTGSSITIDDGSFTLRLAGTATTGNRTLGAYGWCSIMKVASSVYSIGGPGVS